MDCVFLGDTCSRCGVKTAWPDQPRNCRPGLGDHVHAALSAVGITPQLVAAALGVDDCGCEGRRKWLNQAGRSIGIGTDRSPEPVLTSKSASGQSVDT